MLGPRARPDARVPTRALARLRPGRTRPRTRAATRARCPGPARVALDLDPLSSSGPCRVGGEHRRRVVRTFVRRTRLPPGLRSGRDRHQRGDNRERFPPPLWDRGRRLRAVDGRIAHRRRRIQRTPLVSHRQGRWREYDSDGLRIRRDPEHGPYYVRAGIVLMPLRQLGTGWLTGDPKWCVAYNGMSDRLFIARRARAGGRVPRHLRGIEELDDWRSTMQEIDHRAHPWRAKDPNDT